jgi:hypothetical protein
VANSYATPQNVSIIDSNNALPGFQIYYTLDGSTPTTASTAYTYGSLITVAVSETIKALATATSYSNSAIPSATYHIISITPVQPLELDSTGVHQQIQGGVVSGGTTNVTNWSSGNTAVATINSSGIVTAVAAGTAVITAQASDLHSLTSTAIVTVGKIVTADIKSTQSFLWDLVQSLSSTNPFQHAQWQAAVTALNNIRSGSMTPADLELVQSYLSDEVQQLSTAGPYQAGQLAAVKQALADVRSLL